MKESTKELSPVRAAPTPRAPTVAFLPRHGRRRPTIHDVTSFTSNLPPSHSNKPPEFHAITTRTRRHGIVLIFDEVIAFRVGPERAQGRYGGQPDLTTFGKLIGGGVPIGAVGGRRDIMALLDPANPGAKVISGGTYSGNPPAAVADIATLNKLTPEAYARLDRLGRRLRDGTNAILRCHNLPAQVTGDASLFQLVPTADELVNYRSIPRTEAANHWMDHFHRELLSAGTIISHRGLSCLSTPMTEDIVDEILGTFERAAGGFYREGTTFFLERKNQRTFALWRTGPTAPRDLDDECPAGQRTSGGRLPICWKPRRGALGSGGRTLETKMWPSRHKAADQVFGVSPKILQDSYIDRGSLDSVLAREIARPNHLALRGESKCGKSWLRQKVIRDALVVQCRLRKSVADIYTDILSQLDIKLELEETKTGALKGRIEAKGELGSRLLSAIGLAATVEGEMGDSKKMRIAGHTVDDLKFIADLIQKSNKKVVIEDFHYMSIVERKLFAHDLKTFWDYGLFFVIVGVWTQTNMLISLNPDLSNRIKEIAIVWSNADLYALIDKGSTALGVSFSDPIKQRLVGNCFGNVAILQRIILTTLDKYFDSNPTKPVIDNTDWVEAAELEYAEELNSQYQVFAKRLASSIRNRRDSTGINAYAMAVILDATDESLTNGLSIDVIFSISHSKQPRIQKGNLRRVLENFEKRQIDEEGKGLIFSYNEHSGFITIVDRQLLFYRKFSTVKWPWEDMIKEAEQSGTGFDGEDPVDGISR